MRREGYNGPVAGEGRFSTLRGRLRRRRSADDPEGEGGPEPAGDTGERPSGLAPLSLGEIEENRRESVTRRLDALRERGPRRRGEDDGGTGSGPVPARRSGRGLGERAGSARSTLAGGMRRARDSTLAGGSGIGEAWHGVPAIARVRLAAAAIVAALVAILLLVVVPAVPCGAPGGDQCPAPDDAIALVPDDALAYAHVDIDPEGQQFRAASDLASRVPLLSRLTIGQLAGIAGRRVDFESQVRPWAGGELAVAVLPGLGRLEQVVLVEADDAEGAQAFAVGLLGAEATIEEVAGIEVSTRADGGASAIVNGFLVLGDVDAVTGVIDPDEETTLESATASTVLEELPDERVAYAYLSAAGARALLRADGPLAPLAPFDTFVDAEASRGIAVALTAADDLLELEVRSELDPERATSSPPFFAALPPFEPTLPADVGPDALAYLGIGDPEASVESLLTQAAADAPALLGAFDRVERDLRREGGISLTGELLSLLGSEAAIAVEPVDAAGAAPPPGTLAPSGVPYLSVLVEGVDEEATARSLAALQAPLVDALAPSGSGKLGAFETQRVAGVDAQSLLVNPDVNLTYATFDDRLVVATNPIAVEQARADGAGLEDSPEFELVTEDLPEQVSLLAYLDLRSLLALGEQLGLSADPAYSTLAPDLRTLDAAALAVSGSSEEIRTDLRIAVGQPETAETGSSPLGAP